MSKWNFNAKIIMQVVKDEIKCKHKENKSEYINSFKFNKIISILFNIIKISLFF